jgi:nitrate reductase delta subunit
MMTVAGVCDLLASTVAYPRSGYTEHLEDCARVLSREYPEAAQILQPFVELARRSSLEELEELYTLTFDINPVCCLEVGWQLFGEEYARGAFLVDMRQTLRDCGVLESTELPDHLGHVLAALERMPSQAARDLANNAALPALDKMIQGLDGKENPFERVLKAIRTVVQERYKKLSD